MLGKRLPLLNSDPDDCATGISTTNRFLPAPRSTATHNDLNSKLWHFATTSIGDSLMMMNQNASCNEILIN
jgi:hypothetical protein